MTSWNTNRAQYRPDSGIALDNDGASYDVTGWRKSVDSRLSAVEQTRNNLTHQRTYSPEETVILGNILSELRKMNTQLSIITGEEL